MIKKLLPLLFLTAIAYSMQNQIHPQNALDSARQIKGQLEQHTPTNDLAINRSIQAEFVRALNELRRIKDATSIHNPKAKKAIQLIIYHVTKDKTALDRHILHQRAPRAYPAIPVREAPRSLMQRLEDAEAPTDNSELPELGEFDRLGH